MTDRGFAALQLFIALLACPAAAGRRQPHKGGIRGPQGARRSCRVTTTWPSFCPRPPCTAAPRPGSSGPGRPWDSPRWWLHLPCSPGQGEARWCPSTATWSCSRALRAGEFLTILAALDTGSAFEGMGASREAWFSALTEPALLLALAALARLSGSLSLSGILGGPGRRRRGGGRAAACRGGCRSWSFWLKTHGYRWMTRRRTWSSR